MFGKIFQLNALGLFFFVHLIAYFCFYILVLPDFNVGLDVVEYFFLFGCTGSWLQFMGVSPLLWSTGFRAQWLWHTGLVALQQGSFQTRHQTRVSPSLTGGILTTEPLGKS